MAKLLTIWALINSTLIPAISSAKTAVINKSYKSKEHLKRSPSSAPGKDGVLFNCEKQEIVQIKSDMLKYFKELNLDPKLLFIKKSKDGTKLNYVLNSLEDDVSTLDLGRRKELQIEDEVVELPKKDKTFRKVTTVSKKEIVLALFQHGRLSEFHDNGCNVQAFIDHVGIRQNIVAWTEDLNWGFPDGKAAGWNPQYWDDSPMPIKGPLYKAINDLFMNQNLYSMGCYSASKAVQSQGVLDYYARVRPDSEKLKLVEKAMLVDKEPLSDIEPGTSWDFLKSTTPEDLLVPGKILTDAQNVAPRNFIPGDWVYIRNTDPGSSKMSGYEGSNAIYLGRNNFDDYYGEMDFKHYTFEEKINEVYQWRNGVFTASDSSQKKKKILTDNEFNQLLESPKNGGILSPHRIVPKVF